MIEKSLKEYQADFDDLTEKLENIVENWLYMTSDRSIENMSNRLNIINVALFTASFKTYGALLEGTTDLNAVLFLEDTIKGKLNNITNKILSAKLEEYKDLKVIT